MSKKLTWVGIGITAAYLIAAALLGWGEWDKFSEMEPNEVGDFLAGVVGPLALLWLILGFFQQGEELRLSTEALREQARELSQSVQHQKVLAEATKRQVEVQLEAIKQDREAARIAWQPSLILDVEDCVAYDKRARFRFRLRNLGHRISDIVVEFSTANDQEIVYETSELLRDGALLFDLEPLGASDVGDHAIRVDFYDGADQQGAVVFAVLIELDLFDEPMCTVGRGVVADRS